MNRPSTMILLRILLVICTTNSASALESPTDRIAKSLGIITQAESRRFGNATIIDRCHIPTNFHVVYGKSKDPVTGRIEIFDDPQVGHKVDFSYDLAATGAFLRKTKATVIEFDNYATGVGRGMVADKALLRLDGCVDKEFANVTIDRPGPEQRVPEGNLVALGLIREAGKFKVLVFGSCPSDPATIVTGLFPMHSTRSTPREELGCRRLAIVCKPSSKSCQGAPLRSYRGLRAAAPAPDKRLLFRWLCPTRLLAARSGLQRCSGAAARSAAMAAPD